MKCLSHRESRQVQTPHSVQIDGDEVPGPAIELVLKAVIASGVELGDFFSETGISHRVLAAGSALPSVSRAQFSPFFRRYMDALRNRAGVIYNRPFLSFDCADLLCACILNCKNLQEAVNRTMRFVALVNGNGMRISLQSNDKQATLEFHAQVNGSVEEAICGFMELCFYYKLFSWLVAGPLAESVQLTDMDLLPASGTEAMMGRPLVTGREANAFIFRRQTLKRPIVRTARELNEILRLSPIELLKIPPEKKLSVILMGIFRRSLEEKTHIPLVDEIAYQLGQSGPTLRRHLAKENTSFQELADKCRMEKAAELLIGSSLAIDDISDCLGFSAPSGFSRAFKDWTGFSPSVYRQERIELKNW